VKLIRLSEAKAGLDCQIVTGIFSATPAASNLPSSAAGGAAEVIPCASPHSGIEVQSFKPVKLKS
jgi:hypothetical protein